MGRYITIDTPPTALDSTPLPYQRSEAPLAAFGGNDANALAQFSSVLTHNVANFRDQAKQQQLLNHESEANDAMTAHRLQTTATLGQYTGTRMKETVDSYPSARQALQASHDGALDQVSPAAAALLKPHIGRSLNDALQVAQDHQLRQDHAWSDQSSLDSMHANLQEALLHRDDATKVQQMADHSSGEWLKIGERKGWSPQIINQQSDQTKAQLFGTVIQAHLQDGRPDQAQAYYDQAKAQLTPDTMQRMVQSLQPPQPGDANQPAPDSYRYQGDPNADLTMPYRSTPGDKPDMAPLEQPRPFNFNGPNGNGDPKLFQVNAPVGGQQFAQNTPSGTATDVPSVGTNGSSLPGGQQFAQTGPPNLPPTPVQMPDQKIRSINMGADQVIDGTDSNGTPVSPQTKKHPKGQEVMALTGKRVATNAVTSRADTVSSSFRTSDASTGPAPQPRPDPIEGAVPDKFEASDYTNADKAINNVYWYWNIANVHNVKGDNWLGSLPSQGGVASFTDPEYGVRANFHNLLKKIPLVRDMKDDTEKDDAKEDRGKVKYLPPDKRNNLTAFTIRNIGLQWLTLSGKSQYKPNDKDTRPQGDNLDRWVEAASQWSGLDPDATLNPDNAKQMFLLLRGMNYAEKGFQTVSDDALRYGIMMERERNDELPNKSDEQKRQEFLDTAQRSPLAGPNTKNRTQRNIRQIITDKFGNQLGYRNFFDRAQREGNKP